MAELWSRKVGTVFDVRPRVAVENTRRWMDRKEEALLRNALVSPGVHVCLYGPSGSGKTSLAKTIVGRLAKRGERFLFTRINNSTSWDTFKSHIIENKQSADHSDPFEWKIGIKNLLPYIEFCGASASDEFEASLSRTDVIERVDIRHLAEVLIAQNTCLVIDDVHFAHDELLHMLTSLAKEVTDRSTSNNSKLVFIGADDIFLRLLDSNPNLRDRTDEIALGSIREEHFKPAAIGSDVVWNFIAEGLVDLGLLDPRKDTYISTDQRKECRRWVEYAADGLPKSIIKLGRKIAERGIGRSRVSHFDIINTAKAMIHDNFRQYRNRYKTLFNLIKNNDTAQQVCLWMFKRGASKIHTLEDVTADLSDVASYYMLEEAIQYLSSSEFVVLTGSERNVFFAKDPLLAHTIGVAMSDPESLEIHQDYFIADKNAKQLLLRLEGAKEPEKRTRV